MRQNKISRRGMIAVGQKLRIPGGGSPSKSAKGGEVVVKRGDTVCGIAQRLNIPCRKVLVKNGLKKTSLIRPGQTLKLPGTAGTSTALVRKPAAKSKASRKEKAPKTVAVVSGDTPGDDMTAALDSEIDLRVRKRTVNGKPQYYILVEPEETLGHYADWLGIGYATRLRRLNNIPAGNALKVGQRVALTLTNAAQATEFEARRLEYHRVLVEEFKEHFVVTGLDTYKVKSGDSAWKIAAENELPLWVVTRYNPKLRKSAPAVGMKLMLPNVREHSRTTPGS